MSRFIKVAEERKINNLVRVTGDNPLADPVQMDNMIISHFENNLNLHSETCLMEQDQRL